jgi:hypothetical protein
MARPRAKEAQAVIGSITMARRWAALALIAVAATLLGVFALPSGHAEAKSVTWTNYDVTLTLKQDGSYHVAEHQTIDFTGGPFTAGTATIPLARIDDIENVKVSEISNGAASAYRLVPWNRYNESENTFSWTSESSQIEIGWGFPSVSYDSREFLLEYDVIGALRVYPDATPPNQQIWWTAIGSDVTDIADVDNASMTIVLPEAVSLADAVVDGPGSITPSDHTTDGKTWTWTASDLHKGDSFEVRLQVPPIVNATAPAWQQADDARRQAQEKADERNAALNVIFLGIGLGLAALGGIGLYALWYLRGRDPHVGLVAEFLATPPDDLPAAAVGVLTDERVDSRDLVAGVVDLARRGVIKMDAGDGDGLGAPRDYTLTLLQPGATLAPFEKTLLGALFGNDLKENATAQLSKSRGRFDSVATQLERELYQEVVSRGYFNASPEATRDRWKHTSTVLLIAVVVAGVLGLATLGGRIAFLWFTIAVAALLALVLRRLSTSLPARTHLGAEEAAKWRAFKRYLGDITKYEKVSETKDIFEKNLAFAVAFGLDEAYVSSFLAIGAPLPEWFNAPSSGPILVGGGGYGRRRGPYQWGNMGGPGGGGWIVGGPGAGSSSSGGGGGIPDLQDMSDSAGRGVQSTSDSFFDMLNKAAKAFGSSSGSRGSWGGGGGHSGGFSGGGSHGGSSGGGGRGFH